MAFKDVQKVDEIVGANPQKLIVTVHQFGSWIIQLQD